MTTAPRHRLLAVLTSILPLRAIAGCGGSSDDSAPAALTSISSTTATRIPAVPTASTASTAGDFPDAQEQTLLVTIPEATGSSWVRLDEGRPDGVLAAVTCDLTSTVGHRADSGPWADTPDRKDSR